MARARSTILGLAMVMAPLLPAGSAAQSELDASEAEAFLGSWLVAIESDFGPFQMDLDLADQDGKVAATITSVEMGAQDITDIRRAEESLVLTFEADAQGQFFEVFITLEPNGEDLDVLFEVGAGEFTAYGVATRVTD